MDRLAGLSPDDAVFKARRFRPEFVDGAEMCRVSVLEPQNDQGLAVDLRLALAIRMARLNADEALTADYQSQFQSLDAAPDITALAGGATDLAEPLATIARHVDLVTLEPIKAEASDITRLKAAGLSNPQIVALSELIAFVNFQTRVAAGLRLMRSA
ncbi:hypothetical protein [Neorhizobium sp. NCHU2750]|uniref:CMD domain-containing protein n=1 Tax=Neorhizobium sp. NCHU2750 TaxID=1825976 RepID=UPI000E732C25